MYSEIILPLSDLLLATMGYWLKAYRGCKREFTARRATPNVHENEIVS
jgi:hypothetical protein